MSILLEVQYFLKKKSFLIPLILVLVLSFGFSITHIAQGVDDLCRSRYVENGYYIGGGRIFGWLVMLLLGPSGQENWLQALFGDIFLGIGAILACVLFRRASQDKLPTICYTIFACLLVSCPLNMAQWVYADTAFMVKLSYTLVPLSLLSLDQYFSGRKLRHLLFSLLFILLPLGMFESAAAVFVFYVGAYLTLREFYLAHLEMSTKKHVFPDLLFRGIICAGILALAIVLKSLLTRSVISFFSIDTFMQETQSIAWFSDRLTFTERLVHVFEKILIHHVIAGLFCLPLGVVLLGWIFSLSLFVLALCKRRPLAMLSIFIMCLSPVLLLFVHGNSLLYRTCQAAAPFAAFMLTIPAWAVSIMKQKRFLFFGTITLSFLLAVVQGLGMDRLFRSDYARYQDESEILTNVYQDLSGLSNTSQKPVCFFADSGEFPYAYEYPSPILFGKSMVDTSDPLYDKLYGRLEFLPAVQYLQELPSPSLNWACIAFNDRDAELYRFLNHLNLSGLKQATHTVYDAAAPLAKALPAYPNPGYIQELEDCIIVNLG